jgi:hypothetical protein
MPVNSSFFWLATVCGVALGASAACSNSPTTGGTAGAAGTAVTTAGTPSTGGGGAGTTGGVATGGAAGTATGGGTTGGVATGGGGGGTAGSGPVVACKAGGAALNGSGLTVSGADLSAFKLADKSSGVKMAYDPIGKVVVTVAQNGTLSSFDPNFTLPTTAATAPVGTIKTYDSAA